MAIQAQTIVDRAAPSLDAEGNDYYTFDQDYKPAINNTSEWLVSVFNEIFGEKKTVPEQLRELVKIKVWQANKYSRVSYNPADTGHQLWSILSVMPEPKLHPGSAVSPLSNPVQSVFVANRSFVSSKYAAARLSGEQWNLNSENPFLPGNTALLNGLKQYAYRDFADYSSSSYTNPVNAEIEIRPSIPEKYVAIEYLKYPTPVNLITDSVEFPVSMLPIITDKVLSFMSVKQGDGTNLWSVTEGDVKRIMGLFS